MQGLSVLLAELQLHRLYSFSVVFSLLFPHVVLDYLYHYHCISITV